MGREIVYCWKCACRLQGVDFESGRAYRVGDQVSCSNCVDELVADLPAEEQEAILNPPRKNPTQSIKKISSPVKTVEKAEGGASTSIRRAGSTGATPRAKTGTTGPVTKVRTGATGSVPTTRTGTTGSVPTVRTGGTGPVPKSGATGIRKKATGPIPKVQPPPEEPEEDQEEGAEKPPMDEKKKRLLLIGGIGGGLFLAIVVLAILVLTRKPEVKHKHPSETAEETKPKVVVVDTESPKEKAVKALLKDAFALKALGPQLKKLREAQAAAAGTNLAADVDKAVDDAVAKIEHAIAALDDEVKTPYTNLDFKTVLETYQKARGTYDVPEWTGGLDTKISLVRNKIDDTFHQIKKKIEFAQQAGEEPKISEARETITKWQMPEYVEQFDKFLALLKAGDPGDPGKNPADAAPGTPPRTLSPAMQAFMPVWQNAITLAFSRDYASAITEMTGAAARAESDEAKKAGAEDVETLKTLSSRYSEILNTASETPKLQAITLEYQDSPGVWKKVTGKALKVEPTRMEFKPDPKDGKDQPAIFIEFLDLNAGSLATLFKLRKGKLERSDADLLTRFALIEGATDAAQALGGSAPARYWVHAADIRDKAPKPNSREFEARTLFHQSEFEWRKPLTRYNAIEKSKLLLSDYTSTIIVKKYQLTITQRAETGKEYSFLPGDMVVNGDYNQFKNTKKDDPSWVTVKDIDFKDQLYNFVELNFIALPSLTYRCWVYAGGCCQEVWDGSYQATEGTTNSRGKQVSIDPGAQMAAQLPVPPGLKKKHDEHKPKGSKENPKNPARWEWIQIPLPKTFAAPGPKQVRILAYQSGFGVKYAIISSSRTKPPDEQTAKEMAKDASGAPAARPEVKTIPQPKEWLLIGPFPEGLATEQPFERDLDITKEYKGKVGNVRWKLANATMKGEQAVFDWDKGGITPKDNVSAYALIHVKAPAAMDARLLISHDDGGRVWLNDKKVHESAKTGAMKADEFNVPIRLEEGWNRILFKVTNVSGGFGLMMRIADQGKAPIPALQYSPYGDKLDPQ